MSAAAGAEGSGAGTSAEAAARAVQKRFDGLVAVRNKAVKGKGAWYWAHLEPVLLHHPDSAVPKAVKLRCRLCDATFSASNPSRTASEHLKRGTCPNFASSPSTAAGGSVSAPPIRKRPIPSGVTIATSPTPASAPERQLVLSGGKEDLGALAMLEDSVKRLKSPKQGTALAQPVLAPAQAEAALGLLADWLYESCGAVSIAAVADHPKFRAFLAQLGLPTLHRSDLLGPRLDARFTAAAADADARIHDALFFQLASHGWRGAGLVTLTVNLPNGTSVFRRAVLPGERTTSRFAEEVLRGAVDDISPEKCVGIVADRFKGKALRNLERQSHWMINLSCQLQSFHSLIKDFQKQLHIFKIVSSNCAKLADLFNSHSIVRSVFHKYQLLELGQASLLTLPPDDDHLQSLKMVDDVLAAARPLQLAVMDEVYRAASMNDPVAKEVGEMIDNMGFWSELEAVHSLAKLVKSMAREIELERPLIGRCLPLWEELRSKVKEWCVKYNVPGNGVEKTIERRFKRNYHPAWSAAFILDPLYLIRDISGKYLPPFKYLAPDQEKDVDKLITRLVSREEAHIVLMELMKWRSEGLDPLYAQAVQMRERDPATGKMKVANPQSSRLVWETCLSEFKCLGKVAVRLIFMHATSCAFKCNWSFYRWISGHGHSRLGMERAQKMIFVAANAKLERRDFSSEEEKDAELFADGGESSNVLAQALTEASSIL